MKTKAPSQQSHFTEADLFFEKSDEFIRAIDSLGDTLEKEDIKNILIILLQLFELFLNLPKGIGQPNYKIQSSEISQEEIDKLQQKLQNLFQKTRFFEKLIQKESFLFDSIGYDISELYRILYQGSNLFATNSPEAVNQAFLIFEELQEFCIIGDYLNNLIRCFYLAVRKI